MSDIGIIGGADGPTVIYMATSSPLSKIIFAVAAVAVIALVTFVIVKFVSEIRK